ncbi:hypothetical protein FORC49_0085 [Listeria monocytogenes]|nr:hypothetical protein FORC49_0085 [Listeria monocytogenes]QBZ14485.1 hypothetical protein FORC67_0081 [Listeria monocytogenes]
MYQPAAANWLHSYILFKSLAMSSNFSLRLNLLSITMKISFFKVNEQEVNSFSSITISCCTFSSSKVFMYLYPVVFYCNVALTLYIIFIRNITFSQKVNIQ